MKNKGENKMECTTVLESYPEYDGDRKKVELHVQSVDIGTGDRVKLVIIDDDLGTETEIIVLANELKKATDNATRCYRFV